MKRARLYLVSRAQLAAGSLVDLIPDVAAAGVDVVQLREKDMEAGDLLRVGEPIVSACKQAGIPFILNDRPDVALALGADGVHLGQNDLPAEVARRILGDALIGRSTHSSDQIDAAHKEGEADYVAVGPVYETPTKPGRPAVGLELVAHAAASCALPWFAIGGIEAHKLPEVMAAGARRVVIVRAITQAPDPAAAAAELREILDSVPL